MKISPIVAWYDLWVGSYWDQKNRWLYVLPVPCVGLIIKPFEGLSPLALLPWERLSSRHRQWLNANNGTVSYRESCGSGHYEVTWHAKPIQAEDGSWVYRSYTVRPAHLITPRRAVERAMQCADEQKNLSDEGGKS